MTLLPTTPPKCQDPFDILGRRRFRSSFEPTMEGNRNAGI